MDNEVNARLAAVAPVELLQQDDLVRECSRLRARIGCLQAALLKYGAHVVECDFSVNRSSQLRVVLSGTAACTCGLEAVQLDAGHARTGPVLEKAPPPAPRATTEIDHDCDTHGHEVIKGAAEQARNILRRLEQ